MMRLSRFWIVLSMLLTFAPPPVTGAEVLPNGAKLRLGSNEFRTINVDSTALSPDGKLLAYRPSVETIRIVEALNGKEVRTLTIKEKQFGPAMSFTTDGRCLTFIEGKRATVLDATTGEKVGGFDATCDHVLPFSGVLTVKVSANGSVGVSGEVLVHSKVKLWDVKTGKEIGKIEAAQNSVIFFHLAASGKVLLTGGSHERKNPNDENLEEVIEVWDTTSLKRIRQINIGEKASLVRLSPDGKWVGAALRQQDKVAVWETATGRKVAEIPLKENYVFTNLTLSPDGKQLVMTTDAGQVSVWSLPEGKLRGTVQSKCLKLTGIGFQPDDTVVASGVYVQTVLVWKVPGEAPRLPGGHLGNVCSMRFTPDGKELLTAGKDDRIVRWDTTTGKEIGLVYSEPIERFTLPLVDPKKAIFSPDGRWFASPNERRVKLIDVEAKELKARLERHGDEIPTWEQLHFSADSKKLFGLGHIVEHGDLGKELRLVALLCIWDAPKGKLTRELHKSVKEYEELPEAYTALMSKYADQLATAPKEGKESLAISTGKVQEDPWDTGLVISSSHVGMRVTVKDPKGSRTLFDADTGCIYPGAIAISPDGKRLAIGWHDCTVLIFDLQAGVNP